MKKIFPVLLLIASSGFAHAQLNIVGSWEVNLSESLERMRDDDKTSYDTLSAQVKQRIKQAFDNREFVFQSDGAVTIQWMHEDAVHQVQGTWYHEVPTRKLTITANTGEVREFKVTTLTSSILVLKMRDAGGLFQELYLTKKS